MSKQKFSKQEMADLREGGKRLAHILVELGEMARPGVSTKELDEFAEERIRAGGDEPAFLHYRPLGAPYPYPAALCVSVNDEIVHGIPRTDRVLEEGDIVGLDLGLRHEGLVLDSAISVPVGATSEEKKKLLRATKEALYAGIAAARGGARVGDIGSAIEHSAKSSGFSIIEELGGHGVGRKVHEEPFIANYGKKGTGVKLVAGQVIALEPQLALGSKEIYLDKDCYTYKTKDGSPAAHFEHTILIGEDGAEILTEL